MADDASKKRLDPLAQRAKELDDVIQRAAAIQKRIVEEIRQIGLADKPNNLQPTQTPKPRRNGKKKRR
jgi:hypothetical protein